MLSICIPHYNFVNEKLFTELHHQCFALSIEFEILVIDDASETENKIYLSSTISKFCRVIFLDENVGRSKIRNLLAQKAKYEWLLFLDGDSAISNGNFISFYLDNLKADIISGGRTYHNQEPNDQYFLHWNYGFKIESNAYAQFHSNNFMIKKHVFDKLKFDESITNYGYEDVVFGLEAKKIGLHLININNKVLHTGLKTNADFLIDIKLALLNLCKVEAIRKDLQIEKEVNLGKHVFCIYVTDGGANGKIQIRDAESRNVLQKLGVKLDDIILFCQFIQGDFCRVAHGSFICILTRKTTSWPCMEAAPFF